MMSEFARSVTQSVAQSVFKAFVKHAYLAIPAILVHLRQEHSLDSFSSKADEKMRKEQYFNQLKEAFSKSTQLRNTELVQFNEYLNKLHSTLHSGPTYNFVLDVEFIKSILDDELTTKIDGKPFVGTIRDFIEKIFIMNAALSGRDKDYAKDMFKFGDEDEDEDNGSASAAMVEKEDYRTNSAVLFLVELMCKENVDISFKLKVSEEDINSAIQECVPPEPMFGIPDKEQPVIPLAVPAGKSYQYYPPENPNELPKYGHPIPSHKKRKLDRIGGFKSKKLNKKNKSQIKAKKITAKRKTLRKKQK